MKEEINEIIRKLSYTGYTEQDIKSEAIRIIEYLYNKNKELSLLLIDYQEMEQRLKENEENIKNAIFEIDSLIEGKAITITTYGYFRIKDRLLGQKSYEIINKLNGGKNENISSV